MTPEQQRYHAAKMRRCVEERIKSDTSLPAFPVTVQKLAEIMRNPNSGIDQMVKVVEMDPGLTGCCMKLANSAAFGSAVRIANVRTALMRIGTRELRKLAYSTGVIGTTKNFRVNVDWSRFWLHSVLTARLTETLCGAYHETSGKEYLAGLIHDIGKLYIEHYFPEEFANVMRLRTSGTEAHTIEEDCLGITHAEICGLMAERWHLDPDVVHAVRHHHDPFMAGMETNDGTVRRRAISLCLVLANRLATMTVGNVDAGISCGEINVETLPEWPHVQTLSARRELELNLETEVNATKEILDVLMAARTAA